MIALLDHPDNPASVNTTDCSLDSDLDFDRPRRFMLDVTTHTTRALLLVLGLPSYSMARPLACAGMSRIPSPGQGQPYRAAPHTMCAPLGADAYRMLIGAYNPMW